VTNKKRRACGIEKGLSPGSLAAVPDLVGNALGEQTPLATEK
jgi:hypothetical protein